VYNENEENRLCYYCNEWYKSYVNAEEFCTVCGFNLLTPRSPYTDAVKFLDTIKAGDYTPKEVHWRSL